ncbi:hypothetical protein HanXRQr2_Chr16g0770841 [Helianthus annuus]|uniref:Uncharacterized protein n=2 Tax=Helianthus annuus TaxID=4232 RepID=A0A9K3GZQ6_HELAN|nr:probable inactive serine/threonine-protein kinase slob2 [Helianthus annuus]XP_021978112.1 probable inactive serine/threonine-protein kinase slob2 [Helianthus annuus]KAF5761937.1 hypothetical protein HanXRQr2_Chr16g0770841 [Helianthus annuus]KAJ0439703.1 hypothetical protein HanHA300_Chr16g0628221 [Helianthus annuus]KAJ0462101.1 hypothetical protein HanHA89_Chr16g0679631 [Helianthus annuus]KAJ0642487.1 hypothetical protein HanLR1_Chr16g0638761 [Helianthus annuus]KAJ0646361.1 hypothetical pr
MAKTNKYTSLNFNDIYDKKTTTNNRQRSSSSSSISSNKTLISNSRIHGNMLVLTRPSPKPIAPPSQPSPPPPSAVPPPDRLPIQSDSISLRPLGRTGSPSPSTLPLPSLSDLAVSVSPKTNKFVPPHLRPGFHGREEKPEPEVQKQTGFVTRSSFRQGLVNQVEERRPKSGGGYEAMNRPRSSGSNRPFSSG